MQKNVLVGIGVLVLGGVLWSVFFSQETPGSEETPAEASGTGVEHVVVLADEGYTPGEISITLGDTVRFENDTDRPFWPASNLHPSHRDYPEFDPREPLLVGETWSFVFTQEGEWKYHDHLAPYHTGVIIVAP